MSAVIALVLILWGGVNIVFAAKYHSFYDGARKEFAIPGLGDGYIPQGLSMTGDNVLMCGYVGVGKASRIYRSADGRDFVRLEKPDGSPDDSHTGGIAEWGGYVYMTSGGGLSVYARSEVYGAERGGSLRSIGFFALPFEAAFVHVEGDMLYIGEFEREENYPTDGSHHLITPSGGQSTAIIAAYPLSSDAEFEAAFGITDMPSAFLSIPSLAQGMCVSPDGTIYVSYSYGFASSHIRSYKPSDARVGRFSGYPDTPLYYLDSAVMVADVTLFPMSEEIAYRDGRIYVMCESASGKYFFGKFTGNGRLYSFDISK